MMDKPGGVALGHYTAAAGGEVIDDESAAFRHLDLRVKLAQAVSG